MSSPADRSPHLPNRKRSSQTTCQTTHQTVGWLAEELVAQWLIQQGGEIMQRRWHCRWGELDLVARFRSATAGLSAQDTVTFVEVKARREGNWDMDGLLALTPQKQQKLWKTAELFLAGYPDLANLPCRFDVALVHIHSHSPAHRLPAHRLKDKAELSDRALPSNELILQQPIEIGKPITLMANQLSLQHYIQSAFDLT